MWSVYCVEHLPLIGRCISLAILAAFMFTCQVSLLYTFLAFGLLKLWLRRSLHIYCTDKEKNSSINWLATLIKAFMHCLISKPSIECTKFIAYILLIILMAMIAQNHLTTVLIILGTIGILFVRSLWTNGIKKTEGLSLFTD